MTTSAATIPWVSERADVAVVVRDRVVRVKPHAIDRLLTRGHVAGVVCSSYEEAMVAIADLLMGERGDRVQFAARRPPWLKPARSIYEVVKTPAYIVIGRRFALPYTVAENGDLVAYTTIVRGWKGGG